MNDGYIEDIIAPEDYVFGSGKIKGGTVNDGDWRPYLPKFEDQLRYGLETMSCTIYHTLNPIEILQEEQFGIIDPDFSERFTSTLAGTTRRGNSPHKAAETVRKWGLVNEAVLPFKEDVNTWDKFYADIHPQLLRVGDGWRKRWNFKHEWVFNRKDNVSTKNSALTDALKFSPLGVSVQAWNEQGGVYYRNGEDTHWCTLVYGDKDFWYILDTYAPYLKKLDKNYNFGFSKRYSLTRRTPKQWWMIWR